MANMDVIAGLGKLAAAMELGVDLEKRAVGGGLLRAGGGLLRGLFGGRRALVTAPLAAVGAGHAYNAVRDVPAKNWNPFGGSFLEADPRAQFNRYSQQAASRMQPDLERFQQMQTSLDPAHPNYGNFTGPMSGQQQAMSTLERNINTGQGGGFDWSLGGLNPFARRSLPDARNLATDAASRLGRGATPANDPASAQARLTTLENQLAGNTFTVKPEEHFGTVRSGIMNEIQDLRRRIHTNDFSSPSSDPVQNWLRHSGGQVPWSRFGGLAPRPGAGPRASGGFLPPPGYGMGPPPDFTHAAFGRPLTADRNIGLEDYGYIQRRLAGLGPRPEL